MGEQTPGTAGPEARAQRKNVKLKVKRAQQQTLTSRSRRRWGPWPVPGPCWPAGPQGSRGDGFPWLSATRPLAPGDPAAP